MQFSLDVVTDGSEQTSSTVFLTVSRTSLIANVAHANTHDARTTNTNIDTDLDTILARYALSGVSTLTSRLAADQRFKLSPVRAVFCPSVFSERDGTEATSGILSANIPCVTGIPSLLLSLSNYSLNGKLHFVGGEKMDVYVNGIVDIILNRRRYPEVITCVVPFKSESASTWWKVYEDEYIHVHARFYCQLESTGDCRPSSNENENSGDCSDQSSDKSRECNSDESSGSNDDSSGDEDAEDSDHSDDSQNRNRPRPSDIVYIFTLRNHQYSFAVFPPNMADCAENTLHPLPAEVLENTTHESKLKELRPLEFILHVNPCVHSRPSVTTTSIHDAFSEDWKINVHPNVQKLAKQHLATVAIDAITNRRNDESIEIDDGLLVRSLNQAQILHSHLPFAYHLREGSTTTTAAPQSNVCTTPNTIGTGGSSRLVSFQRIRSCTSAILDTGIDKRDVNENEGTGKKMMVICRKGPIRKNITKSHDKARGSTDASVVPAVLDNVNIRDTLLTLESFYSTKNNIHTGTIGPIYDHTRDNNEIDLSSDEDESNPSLHTGDDDEIDILDDDGGDNDIFGQNPQRITGKSLHLKRRKLHDVTENAIKSLKSKQSPGMDVAEPHLLVLGTGCASPAPLRGSSGYALFLPTMSLGKPCLALSIVVECGEGYLTMLGRHASNALEYNESRRRILERNVSTIRMIWISHAHLDHYGDLPNLIHEITRVNGRGTSMCTCYQRRGGIQKQDLHKDYPGTDKHIDGNSHRPMCRRCGRTYPPIVIAPHKVLRFLDMSLQCKNGHLNGERIYIGVSQRDFDSSPFCQQIRDDVFGIELMVQGEGIQSSATYRPIAFLNNIPVEHCPNAHACLLGLNIPSAKSQTQRIFTLAYSGDTRPSSNLVRACNNLSRTCILNISLLLHEATFDDDDRGKQEAIKKRHSTVNEAMGIAHKINADAVLLTHFSQRYPKLPPGHQSYSDHADKELQMASAYDGMLIPLKEDLRRVLPALGSLAATFISSKPVSLLKN